MTRQRITEKRRLLVEQLRAQGYTVREIAEELARPVDEGGLRNPETDEPFGKTTIGVDVLWCEQRWLEQLDGSIESHKGRELTELRLARRAAWRIGDLTEVRLNLAQEARLLGTSAPQRVEGTGEEGELVVRFVTNVDDDSL